MAEIVLNKITKKFGDVLALSDVTMTIEARSFVVLLGPTGAGKTTILRIVSGLDSPSAGDILCNQSSMLDLTPAQRNVAMVFQQYSLYPHLTVRQNLEFPLKSPLLRTPQSQINEKVNTISEMLQITHKLDNKATQLSGGEMQRVSIGRALVRSPHIYLMDEPLSSLDAKLRSELRIELKKIQAELGQTLLYVTHDQVEAMTMATHIGVLDKGKLIQFGSPREVYEKPVNIDVANRLGQPRINILPADIFAQDIPQRACFIGLRPEQIVQGKGEDSQVSRIERLGDQTRLHLKFKGYDLITTTETHTHLQRGDVVKIQPKKPFFFDADGNRIV